MAIYYKVREGEEITLEMITKAIMHSISKTGIPLKETDKTQREDIDGFNMVLGIANYMGFNYDILYRSKRISRAIMPHAGIFDQLEVEELDGAFKLTQRWDKDFRFTPPTAELYFEPTQDRIRLLDKIGRNFRRALPVTSLVAMGYQPDRKNGFEYRKI